LVLSLLWVTFSAFFWAGCVREETQRKMRIELRSDSLLDSDWANLCSRNY